MRIFWGASLAFVVAVMMTACGGGGGGNTNSVPNTAPIANAGLDQTVKIGDTVQLDGSGSGDVDGDTLAYTWSLNTIPAGSGASLSDPNIVDPTFVPDRPGTYVAQVLVSDGHSLSSSATVTITTLTLSSSTIPLSPSIITAGTPATLTATLPSLVSGAASTVMLTITPAGGSAAVLTKTGGGAITLADLGTAVSVEAPPTVPTDNTTFTCTLTVSTAAGLQVTATGVLSVVPPSELSSPLIAVSPAAITGGTTTPLTLALPSLTSGTAASVMLTASPAAGTPVTITKTGGGAVTASDLGTLITVDAPATTATDSTTFTYTLAVTNAADTTATAAGTLAVIPMPVLSSSLITITPSIITAGTTTTLALQLPALTSGPASVSTVTLLRSLNGSIPVMFALYTAADLGTTVTIDAPLTFAGQSLTYTYSLVVSNSATTPASATAAGTLSVTP